MAELGQVAASSQVSASGQLAASCSCWVLSHQTLLWHHRLGHPSMSHLHSMHSRLLVSSLFRSLPSLPRLPAPPCLPFVEGRQRAAPQSSKFPPTTAPLQTLHIDVWGPAPIGGTDHERYFLLVVDDYTRYTNVFPLRRKADVSDECICQSFTLPASPQQNGIAECHIDLIMEVARNSMIHAAAPHFLWSFAVRYAAHQLNLWPCVSELETSPRVWWTGKVGDVSMFQFYHPRERRVFSSQDVTFDDSVCFYRLYLHASHPVPLAPLFLVPVPPQVDPLPPQAEGGDPAADDTAATRPSPRLETPPGFLFWPSAPPPQPTAVDS
ncbi:unnamed protein product [Closterium sp. NIES-53]